MIPVSEHIERRLAELPLLPGVYIMKNAQGKIIYIGKAKVLKKVFLGRYINYQIAVDGCEALESLEPIELSQDISTARHEFAEGDTMSVTLRGDLINIYAADTGVSLMKGVAAR